MLATTVMALLVVESVVSPDWASPVNTALLIVLTLVTGRAASNANRERLRLRDEVNTRADELLERNDHLDAEVSSVKQALNGHRDPASRTRSSDRRGSPADRRNDLDRVQEDR